MDSWTEVIAPALKIVFPPSCPGCLATRGLGNVAIPVAGSEVKCTLTCCGRCLPRIVRRWSWLEKYGGLFLVGLALLGLGAYVYSIEDLGPVLLALYIVVACLAAARLLLYLRPALRVSVLGEESFLLRLRSPEYARQFLDINPAAFEPEPGWRRARSTGTPGRWASELITFVCSYALYVGFVLPFAHARYSASVPMMGVPVAAAATYLFHKWGRARARSKS
jgi:hypothetical protein